jgi:hypothetical protein
MSAIEVTAKINLEDGSVREGSVNYDFGDSLAEMIEKFGDETVYSNALANMKVALQGRMRPMLKEGKDVKMLETMWKPGIQLGRIIDPISAAKQAFATMDDDARAAFLQQLQEMQG